MIPRKHLIAMVVIALVGLAAGAIAMPYLPERVVTHYDITGRPDGWGPRWVLALLFPLITLALVGLLAVLPVLGPFRSNLKQFRVTYGRIGVLVVLTLVLVQGVMLADALGTGVNIGSAMAVIFGAMLAFLGNWLGKVRRNFRVGIRTPWTLANEQVWYRTHRLGAKVFVAVGIAGLLAGLLAPPAAALAVLVGGILGGTVWAVVYSYVVYRRLGCADDLSSPPPAAKEC